MSFEACTMSEIPSIVVERLTKVFRSGDREIRAVNEVSLDIYRGDFVAVIGPSGSGKTTFLRLLCGMEKPTSGRVIVDGVDINKLGAFELA